MLFNIGKLVITPGAKEAFEDSQETPFDYLIKHQDGDYGVVCQEDRILNDRAIYEGTRIFSAYVLGNGEKVWLITEADRSSTCFLLPEKY
jgi:hypothetical protein